MFPMLIGADFFKGLPQITLNLQLCIHGTSYLILSKFIENPQHLVLQITHDMC